MIRIRNWDRFQHYKNRSPPWIKLHRDLIEESEEWSQLSGEAAKLLIELWVLASKGTPGVIERSLSSLAWKLRKTSLAKTKANLQELVSHGFIEAPILNDDNQTALCLQDDSTTIATGVRDAVPEGEGEGETEGDINGSKTGFEEFWSVYPKREGGNPKAAAKRKWEARVRDGVDPGDMIDGVRRYAGYINITGTEPRFVKQAKTFLGPDEWWKESWHITPSQTKQDRDATDLAMEEFQRRFEGKKPDIRDRPPPDPEKVGAVLSRMMPQENNHEETEGTDG